MKQLRGNAVRTRAASTEDGTEISETQEETEQYWYPIKISLPQNKSRTIFAENSQVRTAMLFAIYKAQGFDSPLDQYNHVQDIAKGQSNPCWIA